MKRRMISCFLAAIMVCSMFTQTVSAQEIKTVSHEVLSEEVISEEAALTEEVVEEAISDEVTDEEMTSEEAVLTEEVTKEAIFDEVLNEEVVSEEVVSEEIVPEEVVSEEVVSEEVAFEEVVSEEVVSEEVNFEEEGVLEDEESGEITEAGQFGYVVNAKGEVILTRLLDTTSLEIFIPNTIGNRPVVAIDEYFADGNETMRKLHIPDNVKKIGDYAFKNCTALQTVQMPSQVVQLGEESFAHCTRLTSIKIPKTVIDGIGTFLGCESLKEVTLAAGLQVIPEGMFQGCTALEEVFIPDSVKRIDNYAFAECSKLTLVSLGTGLERIDEYAFALDTRLGNIEFPDTLTYIGVNAFESCLAFTTLELPASLESFDTDSFNGCKNLKKVVFKDGWTSIPYGALENHKNLNTIILPDSVTSIGDYAFAYCSNVTEITLPANLTYLGSDSFAETSITTITIPKTVTEADWAFVGCNLLETIIFEDGTETVYNSMFKNCTAIQEIVLPESVTQIGSDAFAGCTALKKVTMGNHVSSIAADAFANCIDLKSVKLSSALTHLYKGTFQNCSRLETLVIPYGVKAISDKVFSGCTALRSVSIPAGMETIADSAFTNCGVLTISGQKGSVAETFAKAHKIPFQVKNVSATAVAFVKKSTTLKQGEEEYLTLNISPLDSTDAVIWKSSNKEVVTVENGTILARGQGKATITATVGTVTAKCAVTVSGYKMVAPDFMSAKVVDSKVVLDWSAVGGAEGYLIQRRELPNGYFDGIYVRITDGTTTTFTDSKVEVGQKYSYKLVPYNASEKSSTYAMVDISVSLGVPTTAASLVNGGVKVVWSKVPGAEGYRIYRKEAGGSYVKIKTVSADAASAYTDTTAVGGKKYYYAVKAYAGSIVSSFESANVTVPLATPTPKITFLDTGVKVSWNEVSGAESYYVYRKLVGGTYEKIATVTGKRYFLDKKAVPGKQYYYTVKAVAGGKVSGYTSVLASVPKK